MSPENQWWIDRIYPTDLGFRGIVPILEISNQLSGELKLVGFYSLKEVICVRTALSELDVSECLKLEKLFFIRNVSTKLILPTNCKLSWLDMVGNNLTSFDFSILQPEHLTFLDLRDNNFAVHDIKWVEKFPNLKELLLGKVTFIKNIDSRMRNIYQKIEKMNHIVVELVHYFL